MIWKGTKYSTLTPPSSCIIFNLLFSTELCSELGHVLSVQITVKANLLFPALCAQLSIISTGSRSKLVWCFPVYHFVYSLYLFSCTRDTDLHYITINYNELWHMIIFRVCHTMKLTNFQKPSTTSGVLVVSVSLPRKMNHLWILLKHLADLQTNARLFNIFSAWL